MNNQRESWLTAGLGLFLSMIVVVPFAILVLAYAKEIFLSIVFMSSVAIIIYLIATMSHKDKS